MTSIQKTLLLAMWVALVVIVSIAWNARGYKRGYEKGYVAGLIAQDMATPEDPAPAWDTLTHDKAVQDEIERQKEMPR